MLRAQNHRGTATVAVAALSLLAVGWALPARAAGGGAGACHSDAQPKGDAPRVLVLDACFQPNLITIEAGQVVQWDLQASMPHTVTFADSKIDSGTLAGSFAVRFRTPGAYRYSCVFHPGMVGTVKVTGSKVDGPAMQIVEAGPSQIPTTAHDVPEQASSDQTPAVAVDPSEEAVLLAADRPAGNSLVVRIDPLSGLLLVLFGLSVGAGTAGAARVLRGR